MRIKWTDRRFNFDFPAGIYPEMIERIRGTPARLEDLLVDQRDERQHIGLVKNRLDKLTLPAPQFSLARENSLP